MDLLMYFRDSLICMVCKVYGFGCLSLGYLFMLIVIVSGFCKLLRV